MHTLVVQQHLQHTSMGAARILEVHATYVAAIPVNSESGTVSVTEGQFVCFRAQCPLLSAHYDRRSQSTQTSIPYLLVNWYGNLTAFRPAAQLLMIRHFLPFTYQNRTESERLKRLSGDAGRGPGQNTFNQFINSHLQGCLPFGGEQSQVFGRYRHSPPGLPAQ